MSKKLANTLIKSYIDNIDIRDIIWRNVDIEDVNFAAFPPSEKLEDEFISFLEGSKLQKFVEVVPDDLFLKKCLSNKKVKASWVLENPFASGETLKLAGQSDKLTDILTSRSSLENHTPREIADKVRLYNLNDRIKALTIINTMDRELHDNIVFMLFGLTDDSYAGFVDAYMVNWLSRPSDKSDLILGILEQGTKIINGRITTGATVLLGKLGIFLDRKRSAKTNNFDQGVALNSSMLNTLKLTGMSSFELMPMVMSTTFDMKPEELCGYLEEAHDSYLSNYLAGDLARKPNGATLDLLFSQMESEKLDNISTILLKDKKDELAGLPWFVYLLKYLPKVYLHCENEETPYILSEDINLNNDKAAWEFLLVVSSEWESGLDKLVEASKEV